jgi:3-methyladenine DNA glycosylase AlkD
MPAPDRSLVLAVRAALREVADPTRAPAMQAYMKSALPFYGVAKPVRVRRLRPVLTAHPPTDRASWEATVRVLYDEASHREERYAALDLLAIRAGRPWHDPDLIPLLEHLVRAGAWWDLVDEVAGHHVAPVHRAHPVELATVVRGWSVDHDIWLRRAAVLSQLGSKDATDRNLLGDVIVANAERPEFWLRKAIGWALRDLSPHDPVWVTSFVATHPELSTLSRHEALRRLPGALPGPPGRRGAPGDGSRGHG